MSARSRRKGATWERELAARWAASIYPAAQRGPRGSQRDGEADVEGTPWWVECKVGARPDVLGAMRQAEAATDGRTPLVVVKRDREAPLVAMRLEAFEALVRYAQSLEALVESRYVSDAAKEAKEVTK